MTGSNRFYLLSLLVRFVWPRALIGPPSVRHSPQPYGGGMDLHGWYLISHWLWSYSCHDKSDWWCTLSDLAYPELGTWVSRNAEVKTGGASQVHSMITQIAGSCVHPETPWSTMQREASPRANGHMPISYGYPLTSSYILNPGWWEVQILSLQYVLYSLLCAL
jgi:hypothetical protein